MTDTIIIAPLKTLVEELAGSLPIPKKWKGKDVDHIIKESKEEYFEYKPLIKSY